MAELNNVDQILYHIVCSRGPGTETMMVQSINPDAAPYEDDEPMEEDCNVDGEGGLTLGNIWADFYNEADSQESIEKTLAAGEIAIMGADEGAIYLCPPGTTDEQLIVKAIEQVLECGDFDPEYMSAAIRSFICGPDVWTSVGAWRDHSVEIMTKEQVEKLYQLLQIEECREALDIPEAAVSSNEMQKALGLLLTSVCTVIAESARLYLAGANPESCSGC